MKKLLPILVLTILVPFAYAEIPARFFETTFEVGMSASNDYFPLSAIYQNPLVIDFGAMANALPSDGFTLAAGETSEMGFNLRLSPKFRMGLFFGTEATGFASLPQSLFALISQGNTLDQTYAGNLDTRGDIFAETGAWFGTRLFGVDLTVRPAYYVPILHIGDSSATYTVRSSSDGTTTANVQATIPVYSAIPLNTPIDGSAALGNLLRSGGVDLTLGAEYPLLKWLTLGVDMVHIPIVLATLNQRTVYQSDFSLSMNDLMANYSSSSLYQTSQSSSSVSDTSSITVARPFELGTHAIFYPFSSPIVSLTPSVGIGMYDGTYMNAGLKTELNLGNCLILYLSSQLLDRLWNQQVGLNLNLRLLELDFLVGSQSSDFKSSFDSGISATLGMKFGY